MTGARCGLVGHPVAHSRSPAIHAAFARAAGIELDYVLLDAEPAGFAARVRAFFDAGGAGLNVTLPHKPAAVALADESGGAARRAGVANVLTRLDDGRLRADNVDGLGFVRDLHRVGADPAGASVLLLGAGGAAAGLLPALLAAGVASVDIRNRTAARARDLAARIDDARVRATGDDPGAAVDLVINATAASLAGACPAFPDAAVGRATLACDLVYADAPTPFMQRAAALGARTTDGWGMLVEQAAESFFLWHGVRPDTAPLLRR